MAVALAAYASDRRLLQEAERRLRAQPVSER